MECVVNQRRLKNARSVFGLIEIAQHHRENCTTNGKQLHYFCSSTILDIVYLHTYCGRVMLRMWNAGSNGQTSTYNDYSGMLFTQTWALPWPGLVPLIPRWESWSSISIVARISAAKGCVKFAEGKERPYVSADTLCSYSSSCWRVTTHHICIIGIMDVAI